MLSLAIVVFLLTSLGGLVLARSIWRGKAASLPQSIAHALIGVVGLLVLAVAVVTEERQGALFMSIPLMVAATVTGFLLLVYPMRGALAPKRAVVVHGCLAVVGLALLASL